MTLSTIETHTSSQTGKVGWRSPSNIAIVKYWGKYPEQIPANPSISFTLSSAATETTIEYSPGSGKVEFFFEKQRNEAFAQRVNSYIERIAKDHPEITGLDLHIESENTFPHSAGIASSASAMSALSLCLGSIIDAIAEGEPDDFLKRASYNARLGSGSASRSVSGPVMLWGELENAKGSSDEFAIEVVDVGKVFKSFRDAILIVDSGEKSVKSSAGHALMHGHPYASQRFARARRHCSELLAALESGDVKEFGRIAESEALDLHAMMMTSNPPFLLMRSDTLNVYESLRSFRRDTGFDVYMTLDAGPNVHLLYPEHIASQVNEWIDSELVEFCSDGRVIYDRVGSGPSRLEL